MKKLKRLSEKLNETNIIENEEMFIINGGHERTSTCWSLVDTCNEGVGDHHYTRSVDGEITKDEVTICDHDNCVNG